MIKLRVENNAIKASVNEVFLKNKKFIYDFPSPDHNHCICVTLFKRIIQLCSVIVFSLLLLPVTKIMFT